LAKKTKLSDIAITHISLVKAGANGKSIIYKSSDAQPTYTKKIAIKKSDEEGVVYGIVYSPDQVDTDGDYATSDEIKKAAYSFMKNKNTANVDKNHTFDIEKAFIAQSWITKSGDATFPDEAEGSWAVAIQLEDDALIKSVKDGEIAGISMAGTAMKEEDSEDVEKADEKSFSLNDMLETMKKVFGYASMSIHGSYDQTIDKSKEEENDLKKEDLEAAITAAVEPLVKEVTGLKSQVETLQKSNDDRDEAIKKSKQNNEPVPAVVAKENEIEGIL
jgi:hypothetical protein